jgi:signal transduction histidine kinase
MTMDADDAIRRRNVQMEELESLRRRLDEYEKNISHDRSRRDALEEREAELLLKIEDLKRSQQQVIQRERLHALGEMASGIVHDFNNALTPILGASDFLIRNPEMLDNKSESLVLLESIRAAARDAKDVVHRLREFYRPEEDSETRAIHVNPLVEQVMLFAQPKWKDQALAEGCVIQCHIEAGDVPMVLMTESHLREVLTNLIFNSVDAMPKGGAITISTYLDAGYVVIQVTDTGVGMTPEISQRCFEPFFSTKGKRGTGLGLATAYGIISKYQGDISVDSAVNEGTKIRIRLPACYDPTLWAEDHQLVLEPGRPLSILVADDNAKSLEILSAHLVADGHTVQTARSSREVLGKSRMNQFDVVLLDRAVPDMGGPHLAKGLRKEHPNLRLVLLTGYGEPDDPKTGSFDAVLEKPATQMDIRAALSRAFA